MGNLYNIIGFAESVLSPFIEAAVDGGKIKGYGID